MIAFCGIDCSKCIGFIATQSGKQDELEKVAKEWSIKFKADVMPEHVVCNGCKASGDKSFHCVYLCKIRVCCLGKGLNNCAECDDYPCEDLQFILDNTSDAMDNLEQSKIDKK